MTEIQWTDHTVNPIIGCTKVSPGCANCYASDLAASMVRRRLPIADRYREVLDPTGKRWNSQTRVADASTLARMKVPRRKRDPGDADHIGGTWRPARVFLGSMTDMLHESLDVAALLPVWHWMASFCRDEPGPTWQIVTKRPHRAREILTALRQHVAPWPRIHLLTTTENQETADERIPHVLKARHLVELVGISAEPLLGPVVLRPEWLRPHDGLGWVIVGGESGADARPCHIGWLQALVDQCQDTGTAVFVKQTGARTTGITGPQCDPKGGDPMEWPPSLRVRQWP